MTSVLGPQASSFNNALTTNSLFPQLPPSKKTQKTIQLSSSLNCASVACDTFSQMRFPLIQFFFYLHTTF